MFSSLKCDLRNILNWFKINSMKTNLAKFQFMLLGVKNIGLFKLNVNDKIITRSNKLKLLGTATDNELKSKMHIEDFFKKASY